MKNYQNAVINGFLANLNRLDPQMAASIRGRLKQSGMAGFWGDLADVIKDGIGGAKDYYTNKKIADLKAKQAADLARQQAEAVEQQIKADIARTENQRQQIELQKEQFELQQFIRDMSATGWQKTGLWVAGGLVALLILNRQMRWF